MMPDDIEMNEEDVWQGPVLSDGRGFTGMKQIVKKYTTPDGTKMFHVWGWPIREYEERLPESEFRQWACKRMLPPP